MKLAALIGFMTITVALFVGNHAWGDGCPVDPERPSAGTMIFYP